MSKRLWKSHELKKGYDVVIIGGGVNGLATAYYLAKMGMKNIAVLESKFVGYGGSGRNTAILRSNYRTPEGIRFYEQSMGMYRDLAQELDYNLMFSEQGHFTLGHSESSISGLVTRAENNKALNVNSYMLDPKEIKGMLPEIDITDHPRYPVMGALYHPPGGIIRHDAVVWAYCKEAEKLGVEVHNLTTVEDVSIKNGKITGVKTNRGQVSCGKLLSAVAGWSSEVCGKVGLKLPIATYPLQAMVTESYKPWLHHVVVSSTLHIYLSQTDRGELVCGNGIDNYTHYGMQSTLGFLEGYAAHVLELFPILHNVKVQRSWAGLCDMTPDYGPIISKINEIEGFYLNGGWGTYGFKAGPASGYNTAKMIFDDKEPEMIEAFSFYRFQNNTLGGEKAAASVGN